MASSQKLTGDLAAAKSVLSCLTLFAGLPRDTYQNGAKCIVNSWLSGLVDKGEGGHLGSAKHRLLQAQSLLKRILSQASRRYGAFSWRLGSCRPSLPCKQLERKCRRFLGMQGRHILDLLTYSKNICVYPFAPHSKWNLQPRQSLLTRSLGI